MSESTGDLYVYISGSTSTLIRRDQYQSDEHYQQAKREASEYFNLLVEHEIVQTIALADQLWFSAHNVSSQWYREPGTE